MHARPDHPDDGGTRTLLTHHTTLAKTSLLSLSTLMLATACVLTDVGHPEGMLPCEPDYDQDGFNAWDKDCYDPNTHEEILVGAYPTVDCDNYNTSVYPGAIEYSDGLDNDCNGTVDDPYYVVPIDADGDGYTVEQGDCDDSNGNINPSAIDLPDDNIDSDCSEFNPDIETPAPPSFDANAESLSAESILKSSGTEVDFLGYVRFLEDMDGDGERELAVTHVGKDRRSRVDVIYGPLEELNGTMGYSEASDFSIISPDINTMNGVRVDSGDINCDGYADLISGDHQQRRVSVYLGGPRRSGDVSAEVADITFRPIDEGAYKIGSMVQVPGDLDGDGCDELLISQGAYDWWTGRALLFYGRSDRSGLVDVSQYDAAFVGKYDFDFTAARFGKVGDLDQDGYDDLSILSGWSVTSISVPDCTDCGLWGKYGFFYGGAERMSGEVRVDDAPLTLIPDYDTTWLLNASSLRAGDFDNDGNQDLVLGLPMVWATNESWLPVGGIGMVLYGSGGRMTGNKDLADFPRSILRPIDRYDVFGEFVSAGDVTGDGIDDIAMVSTMNLQYLYEDYYPRPGYVAIFKGAAGRPTTRYAGESSGGIVYGGYGSMEHVFPIDMADVTRDGIADLAVGTQFFFYDVPTSSTLLFHGGNLP